MSKERAHRGLGAPLRSFLTYLNPAVSHLIPCAVLAKEQIHVVISILQRITFGAFRIKSAFRFVLIAWEKRDQYGLFNHGGVDVFFQHINGFSESVGIFRILIV